MARKTRWAVAGTGGITARTLPDLALIENVEVVAVSSRTQPRADTFASEFGILYDLYHSVTEGEDPAAELTAAGDLVDYVQIADSPGRGQPGSGAIDWPSSLAVLRGAGYAGPIGLEYVPTVESGKSLTLIRSVAVAA